jgi:hypothetical protein
MRLLVDFNLYSNSRHVADVLMRIDKAAFQRLCGLGQGMVRSKLTYLRHSKHGM